MCRVSRRFYEISIYRIEDIDKNESGRTYCHVYTKKTYVILSSPPASKLTEIGETQMKETLKDRVMKARLEASNDVYNTQASTDDSNRLSELASEIERLDEKIDGVESTVTFVVATDHAQDAAIDVITDVVASHQTAIHTIAERIVHDEELIGIDDESVHSFSDDRTIASTLERLEDLREELQLHQLTIEKKLDEYEKRCNLAFEQMRKQLARIRGADDLE